MEGDLKMKGDGNELKEERVEELINEFSYPIYIQINKG